MPSSPARTRAALLILAISAAGRLDAQDTTAVERESVSRKPSPMLLVTPFLSAGWSQTLGTPKAWPRTWGGYGSRLGDQLGFLAVKTTVRHVVDRAVPWVDDHSACITRPVSLARETLTRAGCAIVRTGTLRTDGGDMRPNLPFLTGAVVGTVTSLSWRPERQSAVSSRSFVLQRIAITYGATAFVRLVTDWRADARRQPASRQPASRQPASREPEAP
ncbi:hypothetical protein [Gemmatimonas groenlandica]|uniref:Uncharacterized protein n=1 Tax=Gemmatimonas groenlandica TaxID=2732249 RepID=A0A6M4IUV3_9BACT|nr:hypothetical protein [Gemmatimonas groenlandica]QJR36602.1 hypothetical protein HKW67_14335 [Gemmatimonas groenlandica]